VAAIVQAHLVDPCPHRVLEGEVPRLDRAIADKVRALLSEHRAEIAPRTRAGTPCGSPTGIHPSP
jgi:hypothetical protein